MNNKMFICPWNIKIPKGISCNFFDDSEVAFIFNTNQHTSTAEPGPALPGEFKLISSFVISLRFEAYSRHWQGRLARCTFGVRDCLITTSKHWQW
jgi:hypothetical protein